MSTTTIRSIQNEHQNETYFVRSKEDPGNPVNDLLPNENRACRMVIPWCSSEADFERHHILIVPLASVPPDPFPVTFAVWQDGDFVRFSTDGLFHPNGQLIPGHSSVSGDRNLALEGTSLIDARLRLY